MSEPISSPLTFEQALTTLETIVRDLEQGSLGLAESLSKYEEGVKLLAQCQQLLDRAERRIELLTGVTAAGEPVTKPFVDTPTAEEAAIDGPKVRSRKRSTATKACKPAESAQSDDLTEHRSAIDDTRPLF